MEDDALRVLWRETGGPTYPEEVQNGVGASFIREAVSDEVGVASHLEFTQNGLLAEFIIPKNQIVRGDDEGNALSRKTSGPDAHKSPILRRALVVEDNYVIAKMAQCLLAEAGFANVDIAASRSEGQALIEGRSYDFCLLDIKLGRASETPLAGLLNERQIPIAFATGNAKDVNVIYDAPVVSKSLDIQSLGSVLK